MEVGWRRLWEVVEGWRSLKLVEKVVKTGVKKFEEILKKGEEG